MEKTKLFWSNSRDVLYYPGAGLIYCWPENVIGLPHEKLFADKNLQYKFTKLRLHLKLYEKFARLFNNPEIFTIDLTAEELCAIDKIILFTLNLPILFIGGALSVGDSEKTAPVSFYLKIVTNYIDGPPFKEVYAQTELKSNEMLSSEEPVGKMFIDVDYEVTTK